MDFNKLVIVLTGATGGIGQALAQILAARGSRLLLVARNSEKLAALAQQLGPQHQWISADVTATQARMRIIAQARALNANMLINNAGISEFSAFSDMESEQLQASMTLNLMAPMYLTQAFLSPMASDQLDDKASDDLAKTVINIGSVLGSIGLPFYVAYCASKFGLRGFTESLQRELSQSQHNVLYFAPRATHTGINSAAALEMNQALGNSVDSPQRVADDLMKQLSRGRKRWVVGWPEKIFSRLNGLIPELVDSAIAKQVPRMRKFIDRRKST